VDRHCPNRIDRRDLLQLLLVTGVLPFCHPGRPGRRVRHAAALLGGDYQLRGTTPSCAFQLNRSPRAFSDVGRAGGRRRLRGRYRDFGYAGGGLLGLGCRRAAWRTCLAGISALGVARGPRRGLGTSWVACLGLNGARKGSASDTSPRLQHVRVTCWDDSMHLAAVAAALDLLVLGLLHQVSPEVDPVSRPVSEYALGDFRWLARSGRLLKVLRRSRSRGPAPRASRRAAAGGSRSPDTGHTAVSGRCAGDACDACGSDAQRARQRNFLPVSFGGPPAVPSAAAEGKSTHSRNRCGTGDCDGRSARGERRRGFGLAQRAYLILSALWLLFAALAVLRDVRAGLGEAAAG
jgi:hypothetical protein